MALNRDGNTKIPLLKRSEFTHWKARMINHLRATDPDYIERILEGPCTPMKMLAQTEGQSVAELYEKKKEEWTEKEKEDVQKDHKVINILYNSLDTNMLNIVISCKSAKEIWEKICSHCKGSKQVRKNL